MAFVITAALLFSLMLFLGIVQAHWIAPLVLFLVTAPLLAAFLWSENDTTLFVSLTGLFLGLYASFIVGRIARQ